ncbi:MAG: glycosyltransferase family 4 protein [bacterium]
MNVLHIINVRWYNATAWYAVNLARLQQSNGENVWLVGQGPHSPSAKKAMEYGITVVNNIYLNTYNPITLWLAFWRLKKLITREKIDIVNAHRGEGFFLMVLAAFFSPHKVKIVRTRGDIRYPKKSFLNKILYKYFVDLHIVTGIFMKKYFIEKLSLPPEKIKIIYGGVDADIFKPFPEARSTILKKYRLQNTSILIGIVARLAAVKGHTVLLDAFQSLSLKYPAARLFLIGGEREITVQDLRRRAHSLGIGDKVIVTGYVDDIVPYMASFDLGIISSRGSEAVCRVLMEMMSVGIPVIATKVGSLPEIIEEDTGIIVEPDNSMALAQAMDMALKNVSWREKAGEVSRKKILEALSNQVFVQKSHDVYQELFAI